MKKLVAFLFFTAMLFSLTACGGEAARDAETIKDFVVTENSGESPVTEGNLTESEETRSTDTEENNAEEIKEGVAADPESGQDTAADNESASEETVVSTEHTEDNTMKITAGDTTFTATLADNSSVEALKELLAEGPLTINMRVYYDTNSWNFTRIGKIEGVTGEELLDAFGSGDVTVTFSLE